LGIKAARAWVDAGALYICAWGPDCEQIFACRIFRIARLGRGINSPLI
jgi:hypothetical protein